MLTEQEKNGLELLANILEIDADPKFQLYGCVEALRTRLQTAETLFNPSLGPGLCAVLRQSLLEVARDRLATEIETKQVSLSGYADHLADIQNQPFEPPNTKKADETITSLTKLLEILQK